MSFKDTSMVAQSSLFACVSLFLAVVLPQGIGVRFSSFLPHIDLPRIFILAVIVCGFGSFVVSKSWKSVKHMPISCVILFCMTVWWIITAFISVSHVESILFSLKLLMIGPIYGLAFYILIDEKSNMDRVFVWMLITLGVLIGYALFEFIFQRYLIPNSLKTAYFNFEYYRKIIEICPRRVQGLLVKGPYITNHDLAGILCVFSGFTWWMLEKKKVWGIVFAALFMVALYAVGVRAALVAIVFSAMAFLLIRRSGKNIVRLLLAMILAVGFLSCKLTPKILFGGIFTTKDITVTMVDVSSKKMNLDITRSSSTLSKATFNFKDKKKCYDFLYNSGTIGVRISGFLLNLTNVKYWGLFGYGPGAFFVPNKVVSKAIQYDDPGLFFALMFESGIIMGLLLILLFTRIFYLGLRNSKTDIWFLGVGVFAWFIFSLSSWVVWPMLPAMGMIVLIEVWARKEPINKT